MSDKEQGETVQETDERLRAEADRLLASGLRTILDDYGAVHLIGSYALHLMVWRDLDIHIIHSGLDKKRFFELGGRIAELLSPHRMHYRDETVVATEGLPRGFYWGIYLGDERAGEWKIDIWITDAGGFEPTRAYGERVRELLSDSNRSIILEIKSACWRHPQYRRQFASGDIYSAVLDNGVTGVEGFWKFLHDRVSPAK
ncbi:MAG: hypothetical protein WAV47_07205 [Blastocatellia bacterium]